MPTWRDQRTEAKTYAGFVAARPNPCTGRLNVLFRGDAAGLDTDDGRQPWSTVCEAHGTVCCHTTKQLALEHLRGVPEWCEDCQAEMGD